MLLNGHKGVFSIFFALAVFVLIGFRDYSEAYDFAGWEQGAAGYEKAEKAARDSEEPLIVYFYTSWCGYCKKLDKTYLSSADVQSVLEPIRKVAIDPEKGSADRTLQITYGVRGFPAFFVTIPGLGSPPVQVHPFMMRGSMSTADFSKAIKMVIGRQYNNKGVSLVNEKNFEQALGYLDKALSFYDGNPDLYYNRGQVYYELAQKPKDLSLLTKAEESYQAALTIDGNHQRSQEAPARVRKSRSQWEEEKLSSSSLPSSAPQR